MQTVRSASCLSTCNAVRRVTLITAPGALRDGVSSPKGQPVPDWGLVPFSCQKDSSLEPHTELSTEVPSPT
eukprot:3311222-Prymnesium_polylepis.1